MTALIRSNHLHEDRIERSHLSAGQELGEVLLDVLLVDGPNVLKGLLALVGDDGVGPRRSSVDASRRTRPVRSIRSISRVIPLRLSTTESARTCILSRPSGASARWTRTSNQAIGRPCASSRRSIFRITTVFAHWNALQTAIRCRSMLLSTA